MVVDNRNQNIYTAVHNISVYKKKNTHPRVSIMKAGGEKRERKQEGKQYRREKKRPAGSTHGERVTYDRMESTISKLDPHNQAPPPMNQTP